MAAPLVVPVRPDPQNMIQVLLVHHAKTVQNLVFQRLDHAFHERLEVRRPCRRLLDLAALAGEHSVERLHVLGVLVALHDRAWQVLVLQKHVEVAGLLGRPLACRIGGAR